MCQQALKRQHTIKGTAQLNSGIHTTTQKIERPQHTFVPQLYFDARKQ
jgi:hypothetical protein